MAKRAGARTRGTVIKKDEWKEAFLTQLEGVGAVRAAATSVGIGKSTIYRARQDDPEFAAAMDEVQSWSIQAVEDTLYKRAIAGETAELIFFLKTRKPEVYGDKLRSDQIEAIRAEARRELLGEIQREMGELTPSARKVLMGALPRST